MLFVQRHLVATDLYDQGVLSVEASIVKIEF